MHIDNLYQDLIIEHGTEPRNFYEMPECTCAAEGFNPLCGDKLKIFAQLDDKQTLKQISFIGQGCAISTASASIMSQELANVSANKALEIFAIFKAHLLNNEPATSLSGKLQALALVQQYPSRIKCAMLAWYALQEALQTYRQAK
jgi:nitrogen fixation NifU-like protein